MRNAKFKMKNSGIPYFVPAFRPAEATQPGRREAPSRRVRGLSERTSPQARSEFRSKALPGETGVGAEAGREVSLVTFFSGKRK